MEVDWEVEIGPGAPIIEARWPGFINLATPLSRSNRTAQQIAAAIPEAAAFPPLAQLLLRLNDAVSPLWTSKCGLWQPHPNAVACYIDLLPRYGEVFDQWQKAESFCREYISRLSALVLDDCDPESRLGYAPLQTQNCAIDLVIRQALSGESEGFGITIYISVTEASPVDAASAMALAMTAVADALPARDPT